MLTVPLKLTPRLTPKRIPKLARKPKSPIEVAADAVWRFQLCSGQIRAVPRIGRVLRNPDSGGRAAAVGTP
ncbi:hypothetical protein THI4931_14030 [Pandoraea sputorum]|nr:hypothetical protein THI4931_14030 [Pandoraea sputorum]